MTLQQRSFIIILALLGSMLIRVSGQTIDTVRIESANSVADGYSISLEPIVIDGFSGLQSFAAGQHDGKWVLIGGRTDGLHRMQPFASFAASGSNTNIFVIDPESRKSLFVSVSGLSAALSEQLQATNMQFIQRDNMLYLIGGYGYSLTARTHVTHDKLTALKVDCLISAVQKGNEISPCFRQITNPAFAVTGGQIGRIGDSYFLVGGQRFEGRYNPMGPDHGPGFKQYYTDQIRKFRLIDDGKSLSVEIAAAVTDKASLHRRDFNMLPQIFPGGVLGFTVFSGVFQIGADIPFLNTVNIYGDKHQVNNSFTQHLNHYHSAKVAMHDAANQKMESIFFGGISQYEESAVGFTRNDDVPFTKVISKVTRDKDGKLSETKLGDMPGFLGAGAEFLIDPKVPTYENEIVNSNKLRGGRVLLGYIVGGIDSAQKSIFFRNSGGESSASPRVFRVWLTERSTK